MISAMLPIRVKLMALGITISAAAVGIAFLCSNLYYELSLKSNMDDIKSAVADGTNVVAYFHKLEEQGALSREQAQEQAINVLKTLHNSGDDYLWINTTDGTMIWHPNAGMIGKNLIDLTDPRGNYLFKMFRNVVTDQGAGFVRYYWPKPSAAMPSEKVSYVAAFHPWDWVIGYGMYIDNIVSDSRAYLLYSFIIIAIVIAFVLAIILSHWLFLRNQMHAITKSINNIARGDFFVEPNKVHRRNEFSAMWLAVSAAGNYLGSLERKYLDHEANKIKDKLHRDNAIRSIMTECENSIVVKWQSVRESISEIRATSSGLKEQITEVHAKTESLTSSVNGDSEYAAKLTLGIDKCYEVVSTCSADFADIIDRYNNACLAAQSIMVIATKFRRAAEDDLVQAISLLRNVNGHIRLVDVILNDLVMTGEARSERRDYESVSAETKFILQRSDDLTESLTERRARYVLDIPALEDIHASGIHVFDRRQPEASLANMKAAEQAVRALGNEMLAVVGEINRLGTFSRDLAQCSAKQSAELIKIVWKLSDVAENMESIVSHIEVSIKSVMSHIQTPV